MKHRTEHLQSLNMVEILNTRALIRALCGYTYLFSRIKKPKIKK